MQKIIDQILKDTTIRQGNVHGKRHWQKVAEYGRIIAEHEQMNERILVLFGWFHDCMRCNDGKDPEHGLRAAKYVDTFSGTMLGLTAEEQQKLSLACRFHTEECETQDQLVRACWDCDRLDLGRVGIAVDSKRLSTATAKLILAGELKV